jgi:hypothetical protein
MVRLLYIKIMMFPDDIFLSGLTHIVHVKIIAVKKHTTNKIKTFKWKDFGYYKYFIIKLKPEIFAKIIKLYKL